MIAAGLVLLAVGAADLLREFLPATRRWIGLIVGAIVILALGALSDAVLASIGAVAVAALWVWLSPVGSPARAGFWPVVVVGALCAIFIVAVPARTDAGVIGASWSVPTPFGTLTFDHTILVVGAVAFLLESANVVVRAALQQQDVQLVEVTADAAADAPAVDAAVDPVPVASALKGGRLIGPLERILVFALTLALMYPLLAAVLAAKGIVRFPEISRDSAAGDRAEYFLIGSLVSWVIALAAAFLVWWAFATP